MNWNGHISDLRHSKSLDVKEINSPTDTFYAASNFYKPSKIHALLIADDFLSAIKAKLSKIKWGIYSFSGKSVSLDSNWIYKF